MPISAKTKPVGLVGLHIRSVYLWDYIDPPPLRQHVQRALNRGEDYHQLRRAVSYANFGKLRFKTEHAQQLWGNVRVC